LLARGEELDRLVVFFNRGILSDAPRRIGTVVVIHVDEARPLISPGYDTEKDEHSMRERWTQYYLGEQEEA